MDRRPDDIRGTTPEYRDESGRQDAGRADPGREAGLERPPALPPDPERTRINTPVGPAIGGDIPGAAGAPDMVGEEVLHAQRGPGAVVIHEDELRERMDEESVDGRPPELKDQRRAQMFFWITLAAVFTAVVGILWWYAGFLPALVAVVLAIFFIGLAAWPTWHAAVDRKMDEARIKRDVVDEHLHADSAAPPQDPHGSNPPRL
jgi:hypothetical protein